MSLSRETEANEEKATSPGGAGTAPAAPQEEPTREEIARRAYELFLERGGESGQDLDDWLRAEAELRRERKA